MFHLILEIRHATTDLGDGGILQLNQERKACSSDPGEGRMFHLFLARKACFM